MCLFDERTAGMTSLRVRAISTAVTPFVLPDVSAALMVWGWYADAEPLILFHRVENVGLFGLPLDSRFTMTSLAFIAGSVPLVYTRQSLGALIRGTLWGQDLGGSNSLQLYTLNLDPDTFNKIVLPEGK